MINSRRPYSSVFAFNMEIQMLFKKNKLADAKPVDAELETGEQIASGGKCYECSFGRWIEVE